MTGAAVEVFAGLEARAQVWNPGREVLFVTFDHWLRGKAGYSDRGASEAVEKAGFSELVVQTAQNDWYLNGDLAGLRAALGPVTAGYAAVRCFGFSMGGYAALLLSRELRLSQAVLISPQWSIFPEQMPGDRRYRREAARLDRALGDLRGHIAEGLRGVVLFDPVTHRMDAWHAGLIVAEAPGLARVPCAFGGHPASSHIRDAGLYNALRRLAYGGVTDPAAYRRLHVRARRVSGLYAERRQAVLAARSGKGEVGEGDEGG